MSNLESLAKEISDLEREHGFLGISFSMVDENEVVPMGEVAEFVRDAMICAVDVLKRSDEIPHAPPINGA